MQQHIKTYTETLVRALNLDAMKQIEVLGEALRVAWLNRRRIYICGNGGSAGNAIHLANDFIYGAGIANGVGLRVEALTANPAILTCLANDLGYEQIFSEQLKAKADPDDVLIVLSGSGNSPNVLAALNTANAMHMKTFAIVGFSGGRCKDLANHTLHFAIDDMQVAEDIQLIVGHICMQWLCDQKLTPET